MKVNKIKAEGLYGVNPLLEALKAGEREFGKVYIARGVYSRGVDEIIKLCKHHGIPVYFENRESLDRLSGTKKNQGIFGIAASKSFSSVEEILEAAKRKNESPFVLILDGVEDPRNLGAIIRTADGAGVHGLIIPKHRSAGLSSTAAKTSAGAVEYMPVARVTNIQKTIEFLKEKGLWIYGVDMSGEEEYTVVSGDIPLAIVVGGEGKGIRESIRKVCDVRVRIPLFGQINSLNVSVATGIVLFEIVKQRHKKVSDKINRKN